MLSGNKCVFLDRDGVLNIPVFREGRSFAPTELRQFMLYPDVTEACTRLKEQGFLLVVVTNQPDIGNGKQSIETVEKMHAKLRSELPVDDVLVCPHKKEDECDCRKPKPGMILSASDKHKVDISKSFLVGDRWSDIEAASNAGCRSIFIDHGYKEKRPSEQIAEVNSLREAVDYILRNME